jgi:mRNA-decapping enzyme subunit 2
LGGQSRSAVDGKSPVDKTFLLGFLEDVARRGR